MRHLNHLAAKLGPLVATLALASAAPLFGAAPAPASDAPARFVETEYGPMLVSTSDMTLYTNGGDNVARGTSACNDAVTRTMKDPTSGLGNYNIPGYQYVKSCLDMWKPYQAPADAKIVGDWSIFARPDGVKQWAWQGKPLYFYVRDTAPGDKTGAQPEMGGGGPGGRGGGGGAFRFAGLPPMPALPPGMRVIRDGNAMVLAGTDGRPVYTPRAGARVQRASVGSEPLRPLEVATMAKLEGEWSKVDAGAGRAQFAWKGKALFVAPVELTQGDIAKAGFEKVVYRKLPAPPPEIGVRLTLVGDVYTDKGGKTLYTYNCTTAGCDLPGGGAASLSALCGAPDECMRRWKPYLAAPGARASGDWSVVDVPQPMYLEATGTIYPEGVPRVKGWAYRGKPVFTYYEDKQPGDIWGITVRWFNGTSGAFGAVRVPGPG